MSFLELNNIVKTFDKNTVVKDFNLKVKKGEFVSFLGPSGCGKTTVLRMIAGFETPSAGKVHVDGKDITPLPANRRKIGMVFQSYALFPNLSVADNVAFGLKVRGKDKAKINKRVEEMLEMIELAHLAKRYPYQLSGGQQQRVALARALAPKPKLLLLDEPLSALDAQIRVALRDDIRALQQELGITTVFVTHDQEEAMTVSDRVVVMYKGCADQIGTPMEIYNKPQSKFVASFIGTLNTLEVSVVDAKNGIVNLHGNKLKLSRSIEGAENGTEITLSIRPEALSLQPIGSNAIEMEGEIRNVSFLGSIIRRKILIAGKELFMDSFNHSNSCLSKVGDTVKIYTAKEDILILPN